jgi:hypothetical protein
LLTQELPEEQEARPFSPAWILSQRGWRAAWLWAGAWVVFLRLVVGGMMAVTWAVFRDSLIPIVLQTPDFFGKLPSYTTFPGDIIWGVWIRWDATHYLNLALRGYADLSEGDSVFYPLYAILVRLFAQVLGGRYVLAGLVVATLATTLALALLYKLAEEDYGPAAARWTLAVLALYPTALFLVAPYTESVFLALTLAAFLLARQGRWLGTGVVGALASLARGPGLYSAAALLWMAFAQFRQGRLASWWRRAGVLVGLALPVLGGLSFLAWRAWAGYIPVDAVLRKYSGLVLTNPVQGLWLGLDEMARKPGFTVWLEGLTALAWLGLLALMIVKRRWRRGEWIIYVGLNLGVFLSKHSLVATPLQSIARYVLVLFPGFILLGDWLSRLPRRPRLLFLMASATLLLVFSALYVLAIFIG